MTTAINQHSHNNKIGNFSRRAAYGNRSYPRTLLFRDYLQLDARDYIIVSPNSLYTDVAAVFACGDVADKRYRQAITAAEAGCKAALDAERYIELLSLSGF